MREVNEGGEKRRRIWLWVAGLSLFVLLNVILLSMAPTTPIERVYRPAEGVIETSVTRRVRSGKGTRLVEFYGGPYSVGGRVYRFEFGSNPGTYPIGDTVQLLYNPANPPSNLVYGYRDGAVHLDRAEVSDVLIDFDGIRIFLDSVKRAGRQ